MDERERVQREQVADHFRTIAMQIERGHLDAVKLEWSSAWPVVTALLTPKQPLDFISITVEVEPKKEGA